MTDQTTTTGGALEAPLFLFYGTLMSGQGRGDMLDFLGRTVGPAEIRGTLYSVHGAFPALVDGDGVVQGELWQPHDGCFNEAIAVLDGIEGYRPDDRASSMYLRERRQLTDGTIAYVYVWNQSLDRLTLIPDGDWRAEEQRYREARLERRS